jgi:hypothetical protein
MYGARPDVDKAESITGSRSMPPPKIQGKKKKSTNHE